jgi:hypothetical protein
MYGIRSDEYVGFLIDQEVVQVCYGLHQVVLHLTNDVSIMLECEFRYEFAQHSAAGRAGAPMTASALLELIGLKITSAATTGDGTLRLAFSNSSTLFLFDSNESFESYALRSAEHEVIV